MKGLVCAGKRMHEALLERDNEGVSNMERKYLEECQVMPKKKKSITNYCRNVWLFVISVLGEGISGHNINGPTQNLSESGCQVWC